MVGQRVKGFIDRLVIADMARQSTQPCQKRAAEGVFGEHAVQIAAHHLPIRALRAFGLAVNSEQRPRAVRAFGPAKVDFIAPDLRARSGVNRARFGHALVGGHHRGDIQKPKAGDTGRFAFDTVGIGNFGAQHLIATAKAQNPCPPSQGRRKVDVPALFTEMRKICDGRLAARQDDQIGLDWQGFSGRDDLQGHPGFLREGVEIVEIGDPVQVRDGDQKPSRPPRSTQISGVLCRQPMRMGKPRDHAKTGPAGARFDQSVAVVKEARVAAELVDQEPADHRGVGGVQHHLRADKLGDDTATVDISGQDHGHFRCTGKAHVGDIVCAKVDLGRTAGAFDDHKPGLSLQAVKTVKDRGHQLRLQCRVVAGFHGGQALALNDHLCPGFRFRL